MEAMARRLFLALLTSLFLGVGASAPFRAESFYGLAQPYLFSLAVRTNPMNPDAKVEVM